MKALISIFFIVTIALFYTGCKDEGSIFDSSEGPVFSKSEPVTITGNIEGSYTGTLPGPYHFEGEGSSNLTGPSTGYIDYMIVGPGLIGLGSGVLKSNQTGNEIYVVNVYGTFTVSGTILSYTLHGTLQGGTGAFSKAWGPITYTGSSDLVNKTSSATWEGTVKYLQPFSGNFLGTNQTVTGNRCSAPFVQRHAEGNGNALHIGNCFASVDHCINFTTGQISNGAGSFTAANGDKLDATYTGQAFPTSDPNIVLVKMWCRFTGGTGRFENPEGSVTVTGYQNMQTGVADCSFDGLLDY